MSWKERRWCIWRVSEIGCLTSHWTIFQLYMWRHIDVQADWRRSWTYGRAPNAIDISQGSLTCPSKHRHGTTLFIRWFRHTAPISRLLRSRWGYGGHILNLNPRALTGGVSGEDQRRTFPSQNKTPDSDIQKGNWESTLNRYPLWWRTIEQSSQKEKYLQTELYTTKMWYLYRDQFVQSYEKTIWNLLQHK